MHFFSYKKDQLYCEGVRLQALAEKFGTPLYVYSARTMLEHFLKLQKAFASIQPLICYSVKANSNSALLKLLVNQGSGLDIVSGGELYRAKHIGCPGNRIVYASVGKTQEEIKEAIEYGILMFNVESTGELRIINQVALNLGKKVNISLRFNPDVDAKTHGYITTGKKETKFGMDSQTIKDVFAKRSMYYHLNIVGLHIHIGSQIVEGKPYIAAIKKLTQLIRNVEKEGVNLSYVNIGGGLGIIYDQEKPQTADNFAKKVLPLLKSLGKKVILEPGRFIIGNAGVLLTKVLYIKEASSKKFIIVDAGMNDLIRPSLYSAYHEILPLVKSSKQNFLDSHKDITVDIVGPICESGDFLAKNRKLPSFKEGEYLSVMSAGAYGFSMASNYNSRPRVAEVLVKGNQAYLIREREAYKDLVSKEIII